MRCTTPALTQVCCLSCLSCLSINTLLPLLPTLSAPPPQPTTSVAPCCACCTSCRRRRRALRRWRGAARPRCRRCWGRYAGAPEPQVCRPRGTSFAECALSGGRCQPSSLAAPSCGGADPPLPPPASLSACSAGAGDAEALAGAGQPLARRPRVRLPEVRRRCRRSLACLQNSFNLHSRPHARVTVPPIHSHLPCSAGLVPLLLYRLDWRQAGRQGGGSSEVVWAAAVAQCCC